MEIRAEKELKVLTYFNPVGVEPQSHVWVLKQPFGWWIFHMNW